MGLINPTIPTIGDPNASEDVDIRNTLITIRDEINGALDGANFDASVAAALGLAVGGTAIRDTAVVATEESTASTVWADLTTPGPSVTLTVPDNGFVLVGASANLKNSGGISYVGVYEATHFPINGSIFSGTEEEIFTYGYSTYPDLIVTGTKLIPVTAGTRTFMLEYGVSAGTGTFKDRTIWAEYHGGF